MNPSSRKSPSTQAIQNVSDTAFMVAAFRAKENSRPNPLFLDPLAARLSGEKGEDILRRLPPRAFMGGWSVIIRTRIIDDFIQDRIQEGVDTILNLGAGLDTRPYRMDLPSSLRWVEVDFPHVIDFKSAALRDEKTRCQLERVGVDLTDPQARREFLASLAAKSKQILVLTEGVTPYLTEEEVAALAQDLKSHTSFRYWIADYFSPESYRYRMKRGISKALENAPFQFEPKDYFGFFRKQGWKTKDIRYIAEEGTRLNRPIPLPLPIKLWLKVLHLVLPKEKLEAMRKFMGFVLFEPA